QNVTVLVDTGSGNVLSPQLAYAEVRLVEPLGNLLARGSNSVAREVVSLNDVLLPADGSYRIQVRAPSDQPASTGNYLLALWEVTTDLGSLVFNQPVNGRIETPYSVDRWTFSAVAGQQVLFDFINASGPGVGFDLRGPNGWTGFSNLAEDSGLVSLPFSGGYSLNAHGISGQYDIAYSCRLIETAQTNLAVGTTYTGQFAGSGQAQIFLITLPGNQPLRIALANAGTNNR